MSLDEDDALLQYAIQQSLVEAGTEQDQVDIWEALQADHRPPGRQGWVSFMQKFIIIFSKGARLRFFEKCYSTNAQKFVLSRFNLYIYHYFLSDNIGVYVNTRILQPFWYIQT